MVRSNLPLLEENLQYKLDICRSSFHFTNMWSINLRLLGMEGSVWHTRRSTYCKLCHKINAIALSQAILFFYSESLLMWNDNPWDFPVLVIVLCWNRAGLLLCISSQDQKAQKACKLCCRFYCVWPQPRKPRGLKRWIWLDSPNTVRTLMLLYSS